MKKLTYFVLNLFGLIASTVVTPMPVYGAGCTPIYGGGVDCPPNEQLLLDKKVKHPTTNVYVDNITLSDSKFAVGQTVVFQLTVENIGSTNLSNVTASDTLPSYVEFVSGPGSYDVSTRKLTMTISSLSAGERRTFEINTKVVPMAQLPSNQIVTCVVNSAEARVNNQVNSDTAQICIEKQVLGVPQLPQSGPSETIVFAAGLAALFVVGRKLSRISL